MPGTQKDEALFHQFITAKGLKHTRQRENILHLFLKCKGHVTPEEFYNQVKKKHADIGFATVYRTLKLFTESNIANEIQFGDGQTRYEPAHEGEHHDHLICTKCGKIIEFENEIIENIQREIATTHQFKLTKHRHVLYGICQNGACQG